MGSLIWNPGSLPIGRSWMADGPYLPIELARQSRDGRVTLVLVRNAQRVPALWTSANASSIDHAAEALRQREGTVRKYIGVCDRNAITSTDEIRRAIAEWISAKDLDAAVFTELPPKWGDELRSPTEKELIAYLETLSGDARTKAEEYVRRAPQQVQTPFRKVVASRLGWTPD